MPRQQSGEDRCRQCEEPLKGRQRLYCSVRCHREGRRTATNVPCAWCGRERVVVPSELAQGGRRFCSRDCYWRAKRKARPALTCEQCGTGFSPRHPSEIRRWCSVQCSGRARRKRVTRTCGTCGTPFEAAQAQVAQGGGRYCSRACLGRSKHRRAPVTCERCGKTFPLRVSMAETRRFCSRTCLVGPGGGGRDIACRSCGTVRHVASWELAGGGGKFCSRPCYWQSLRKPRARLSCSRCRKVFTVLHSAARRARKFCTRRCYYLSRGPRRFRCTACRSSFRRPAWRRPMFCSPACAHRGRRRERHPVGATRNRRVFELRAEGLKAPQIRERLISENPQWWVTPAAVRQVISRELRAAARTR